jgi:histidinol-phosphate aminotransferase
MSEKSSRSDTRPEALVAAMQEHRIMVRQGVYHTARFGHRFFKVSTTVPESWGEEFCALLPKLTEQARFKNEVPELF